MKLRPTPTLRCSLAVCAALLMMAAAGPAGAAPSLTRAVPAAAAPGQTVDVTFHGGELEGATGPWTSFPAKVELTPGVQNNGKDKDKVTYRLTLAGDAPLGVGAVRIATAKGISDLLMFMVDDLPSVADAGNNRTPGDAQEIQLPVAVDGACEAAALDYYRFTGKAGQRVSVEVVAQRLGSPLDPVLRLLDGGGREIAFNDDDPSTGADSRLSVLLKEDGTYLLEVRDVRYQSGPYRLRVGDFPLVSVPYPLGGRAGTTATFDFVGPMVEGLQPVSVPIPGEVAGGRLPLAVRFSGGKSSAMATAVVGRLNEVLEAEPNDQPEAATKVTLPCAMNGRLEKPGDRDYYEFAATKGQKCTLIGLTRSLGSPADLFMRLYQSDGKQLAEVEDSGEDEGRLETTFPADGTYRLMVEDLNRFGGPSHGYRVEMRSGGGGFSLRVKEDKGATDKMLATAGGAFAVKVECLRGGYNGPVTLSLDGAPEGCELLQNVIAEGGKETTLLVSLPEKMTEGQIASIRVVGKATVDGVEQSAIAGTAGMIRKRMPQLIYPPPSIDGAIGLGIVATRTAPFSITAKQNQAEVAKTGQLKIDMKRTNKEFKDELLVVVAGLPPGLGYDVKRQGNGDNETYEINFKRTGEAAEGQATVRVIGYGAAGGVGHKIMLENITLDVKKL